MRSRLQERLYRTVLYLTTSTQTLKVEEKMPGGELGLLLID